MNWYRKTISNQEESNSFHPTLLSVPRSLFQIKEMSPQPVNKWGRWAFSQGLPGRQKRNQGGPVRGRDAPHGPEQSLALASYGTNKTLSSLLAALPIWSSQLHRMSLERSDAHNYLLALWWRRLAITSSECTLKTIIVDPHTAQWGRTVFVWILPPAGQIRSNEC